MSSAGTLENQINTARKRYLDTRLTERFLRELREEDFEFGFESDSEVTLRKLLEQNAVVAKDWLESVFLRNFLDESIVSGILRLIGRFTEDEIFPQGQLMALTAVSMDSEELKELGVRAFESWVSMESLQILSKVDAQSPWLRAYIDRVISDIHEQLYAIPRQKD